MKNRKVKLIVYLIIPALVVAGICAWRTKSVVIIPPASNNSIQVNYNWTLFYRAINKYPRNNSITNVHGAIVPHHDLASLYSAQLFQKINSSNIKMVIIIGPNHEKGGAGDIITGSVVYTFPLGVLQTDNLVDQLITEGIAVSDTYKLKTEHSIYNVVPFVSYYFPKAKIVPIILSPNVTLEQAEKLGKYLSDKLNDQTIIIGSIDFSHYLNTEKARINDVVTKEALLNRDYPKLYSLNSDYIDSAPTAVTILSATEGTLEVVKNANQADAMSLSSIPSSTSYFTILIK